MKLINTCISPGINRNNAIMRAIRYAESTPGAVLRFSEHCSAAAAKLDNSDSWRQFLARFCESWLQ